MNNSALRTVDILQLLADSPGLSVSQISKQLKIPKTSAFDILTALTQRGFVRADEQKTYTLGLSAYRVGMAYIGNTDLYSAAHSRLSLLCEQLGQTVYLAAEDRGLVVYLDKAEPDAPIRFTRNPGECNQLYRTGLGKAILAARPELVQALSYPLERKTPTTLCTRQELLADLAATKSRGYALDIGEDDQLLRCVAVPVRDHAGVAIGAISCSMLSSEFEKQDPAVIAQQLTAAALDISQNLGYTATTLY